MYKTVLIKGITTENVTDKIDKQIVEMEKQSYRLITMSFLGTVYLFYQLHFPS